MRAYIALFLAQIMLITLLSPFVSADDVETSGDVSWNGTIVLDGNYTVSSGDTLTISPGTMIDAKEFYIYVNGTLIGDNATIFSSTPSKIGDVSNAYSPGVWNGLFIGNSGHAILDNMTISNASSCLSVYGDLDAKNLELSNCLLGLDLHGDASVSMFTANHTGAFGIRNTGNLSINNSAFTQTTVGIHSTGNLQANTLSFTNVGVGIDAENGVSEVENIQVENVSTSYKVSSGVTGQLIGLSGQTILGIDAQDSEGHVFQDISLTGERLIHADGAHDLYVENVQFTGLESAMNVVDVSASGLVWFDETVIQNVTKAYSISGTAEYQLQNQNISADQFGLSASGEIHLELRNSYISANDTGIQLSEISSTIDNLTIELSASGYRGIHILDGLHNLSDIDVSKPISSTPGTTAGIFAWLSSVQIDEMEISGFDYGVDLLNSQVESADLDIRYSTHSAIHCVSDTLEGARLKVTNSLFTQGTPIGIDAQRCSIGIENWHAEYHQTGIEMDSSTIIVRYWTSQVISGSMATGNGALYHDGNLFIDSEGIGSVRLYDKAITLTDLSDNPLPAMVSYYGGLLTYTAQSDGQLIVPYTSTISTVIEIEYDGVGTSEYLTLDNQPQNFEVPLIPEGDWVIDSGHIKLTARPDGSSHVATGNITVGSGAIFELVDTSLMMPAESNLSISGWFLTEQSTVKGANLYFSGAALDSQGLHVEEDAKFMCTDWNTFYNIDVAGEMHFEGDCTFQMYNFSNTGSILTSSDARFEGYDSFSVTVLDKGLASEGQQIGFTDEDGITTYETTNEYGLAGQARSSVVIDSNGITYGGSTLVTLEDEQGGIIDGISWHENETMHHTFMFSTLQGGESNQSVVLEEIWSPYRLSEDLVIKAEHSLIIKDGAELRVSDGVSITIYGIADIGNAVISSTGSGSRWAGFSLGHQLTTFATLQDTRITEASTALRLSGPVQAQLYNVEILNGGASNALIEMESSSSGTFEMTDSILSNAGGGCIVSYTDLQISLENVALYSCGDRVMRAQSSHVELDGITLDDQSDIGLELFAATGHVLNLDAQTFAGDGAVISLDSSDEFLVKNALISSANPVQITDSRSVELQNLTITGSPGITFDESSGTIDQISIDCLTGGTGVDVQHPRSSGTLSFNDVIIENCTTGFNLHGHSDLILEPIEIINSDLSAQTSLSIHNMNIDLYSSSLLGIIQLDGGLVNAYNSSVENWNVINGKGVLWSSHYITPTNVPSAEFNFELQTDIIDWNATYTGSSLVFMPFMLVETQGETAIAGAILSAEYVGKIPLRQSFASGPAAPYLVEVSFLLNQNPVIEIITPTEGTQFEFSQAIAVSVEASDDYNLPEELVVSWYLNHTSSAISQQTSGLQANFTDVEEGNYVLSVHVQDSNGGSSSDSILIEILPKDSDGDWTDVCNQDSWFDALNGIDCGPDVHDKDDDNDLVPDTADAWPFDPCASLDTDRDGMPDRIDCPDGVTTDLVEDDDDDNDGVLDVNSGISENTESSSFSFLLIFGVFIIFVGLVLSRLRKEENA